MKRVTGVANWLGAESRRAGGLAGWAGSPARECHRWKVYRDGGVWFRGQASASGHGSDDQEGFGTLKHGLGQR